MPISLLFSGDVSLSAEDKPPDPDPLHPPIPKRGQPLPYHHQEEEVEGVEFLDEQESPKHTAFKFLLAGGVAGAG